MYSTTILGRMALAMSLTQGSDGRNVQSVQGY